MADEQLLRILKGRGVEVWNDWRSYKDPVIDLSGADLSGANLSGADLAGANLGGADLNGANLCRADLRWANLSKTDLSGANLGGADLSEANLTRAALIRANLSEVNLRATNINEADLRWANLTEAHLVGAALSGANLTRAALIRANLTQASLLYAILRATNINEADLSETSFGDTIITNVDLGSCKNLELAIHLGPSIIDIRTLQLSGRLPLVFLRGVGLPDKLIESLNSLLGQAIQHYSCFISHASEDDAFVSRLHADLQNKGVRCWFAPEDMKIGAKIRDTLDDAIRLRDKVLLVLSEASIASTWVEGEVEKAFEEERQRGSLVLFPVRLDDAVLTTKQAWAAHLRRTRHIGDFHTWKDPDAYQRTLEGLLRDLHVETT